MIGATIASVQETAAEAITKLIYTYAERIDAGDFAGVAEVFADATLTFEGFGDAVAGREAIEALYARTTRRYEDGTPRTKHVMTNVMVDVADDGETASSRSYFTVLQAVPGALALQPVIAGRYRHTYARADGRWRVATMHITIDLVGRPRAPHALRPDAVKLSLAYDWSCEPEAFWALYYDPEFAVRLHLDALGSTSAEVVSQEGDLDERPGADAALRAAPQHAGPGAQDLRRGGRHHRGEHLRPGHDDDHLHHDAGHHGRQDPHRRPHRAGPPGRHDASRPSRSRPGSRSSGPGPIVERFIEHQARDMQEKAVAYMRGELER